MSEKGILSDYFGAIWVLWLLYTKSFSPYVFMHFTDRFAFYVTWICVFRRWRRQRAPNAASVTVDTLTAGTQSAATLSPPHATAARTRSTAWTPSAHAHDKPRRQTSWSPAAAAMVGNCPLFIHFALFIFTLNVPITSFAVIWKSDVAHRVTTLWIKGWRLNLFNSHCVIIVTAICLMEGK